MIKKASSRGGRPRRPEFLQVDVIIALHSESVASFGGEAGLRDLGALESAVARCRTRWEYQRESSLAELAGALGFGLAKNHAFIDGNKRIALIAIGVFLELNGQSFTASEAEAYSMVLGVAMGQVSEPVLSAWIAANSEPSQPARRTPFRP
jgi:death-on-curing protein